MEQMISIPESLYLRLVDYFDDKSDADGDSQGYHPNEEMKLLSELQKCSKAQVKQQEYWLPELHSKGVTASTSSFTVFTSPKDYNNNPYAWESLLRVTKKVFKNISEDEEVSHIIFMETGVTFSTKQKRLQ